MASVVAGKGDLGSMAQPGVSCSSPNCLERAVTSLAHKDLCFDHFCGRCYELLERADRGIDFQPGVAHLAEAARRLDECAQRALEITLSAVELDNLDRARLLDIVLWSGDTTSAIRRRVGSSTSKIRNEAGSSDLLGSGERDSRVN